MSIDRTLLDGHGPCRRGSVELATRPPLRVRRGTERLPAMEASEELRHVIRRFFVAVHEGDEEAVSRRFSRELGFERFGSDPAEWWHDGEASTRVWLQQMRELGGGFPWTLVGDVHALTEGSVGWGALRAEWGTPNGPQDFRLSFVLHLEHDEWRIVHCHGSVPSPNEEHGFLLTTSVDDIAESVTISRPDLSATSAADGTVTIAFTDIEDSTRLNGLLGDERWLDVLHAHRRARVLEALGDASLDRERTSDGGARRRKGEHEAVALVLHDRPPEFGRRVLQHAVVRVQHVEPPLVAE